MYKKITLNDVCKALEDIENIERPDMDNEGEPINSPDVYDFLSFEDMKKVDHAIEITGSYVRDSSGEVNRRSVTELNKHGFETHFNEDQYDPYRYVGSVQVGNWELDISDPPSEA